MLNPTSFLRRAKKNFSRALHLVSFGYGDGRVYEAVPGTAPGASNAKAHLDGSRSRIVVLILLQVALGLTRDTSSPTSMPSRESDGNESATPTLQVTSSRLAALEALKLVSCLALVYFETRRNSQGHGGQSPKSSAEVEAQPLRADEGWQNETDNGSPAPPYPDHRSLPRWSVTIALLATLLVANSYLLEFIMHSGIQNALAIHLSTLFAPLISAVFLRLLKIWSSSPQQWLGILLQILGLLNFETQSSLPNFSSSTIILLIGLAFHASLTCITAQHVYKCNDAFIPNKFNTRLFAYGLITHLTILILSSVSPSEPALVIGSSFRTFVALVLRASVDIAGLNLIYEHGPVLFGTATSVSTALLLAYTRILGGSLSVSEICSFSIALLGFYTFWSEDVQHYDSDNSPSDSYSEKKTTRFSSVLFFAVFLLMLGTAAYIGSDIPVVRGDEPPSRVTVSSIQSNETIVFTDLPYIPAPPIPAPEPMCSRASLPSEEFFVGNRTYHEFDDVLLIVFFSHARYDVNLDYYKEVYSEFFPNMVFVGPQNREDKGFEHSFDVLVDSYESEEDISDWNDYKMAGRMAHHMLYTVLTTPPYSSNCYKGYLWAPFDTLLNLPRLQLFDQDRIWYFSPWGEYVPNPAVDEERWINASSHAPPARISPDPGTDFEKTYRGWWVDWWWGDPHYGIPVCKDAFERVPIELREQMAQRFTKNETRYIGGSADTLYIPARLADQFVGLLGTFLSTACFLEIAVPTVVHLLVPENEEILFVDHWWIWEPPFNASFVRERWQKELEVDTFHTFHWGDKDSDGVWRANPHNIEDVRQLFRESAVRQDVEWFS